MCSNLLVEPDDVCDIVCLEVGKVVLGSKHRVAVLNLVHAMWPCKGKELIGHNPVEVSVFDTLQNEPATPKQSQNLVVLILVGIKGAKVQETMQQGLVDAAQAVQHCQLICTCTIRCVSMWIITTNTPSKIKPETDERRIHGSQWTVGQIRTAT
jgi:hypothetical protein